MASDGKIIIDTGMDLSGLEKDYKELKNKLTRLGESTPDILKQQEKKLDDLIDKYKKLSGINISNKSLKDSQKDLEKMQKELAKIEKQFQKFLDTSYGGIAPKLDDPKFGKLAEKLASMDKKTKSFYDTWVKSVHEVSKLETEVSQLETILEDIGDTSLENLFGDIENKIKGISNEINNISVKEYGKELYSVEAATNEIVKNLKEFKIANEPIIKTTSSLETLAEKFNEINKISIGEAGKELYSVESAINKIVDDLTEFKNTVGFLEEFKIPEESISSLETLADRFNEVSDSSKRTINELPSLETAMYQIVQDLKEFQKFKIANDPIISLKALGERFDDMGGYIQDVAELEDRFDDLSEYIERDEEALRNILPAFENVIEESKKLGETVEKISEPKVNVTRAIKDYSELKVTILSANEEMSSSMMNQAFKIRRLIEEYETLASEDENGFLPQTIEQSKRLEENIAVAVKRFQEMQDKMNKVEKTGSRAFRNVSKEAKKSKTIFEGLSKTLTRIYTRVKLLLIVGFILTSLRNAISSFTEYIGVALKANSAFVNSFAKLKGNIATAIQPIVSALIPIITSLINILNQATVAVIRFFSYLSGKSVKSMQDSAKNMDKLTAATKKNSKASKAANKENEKMLASFDEINQLAKESQAGGGGAEDEGIMPEYQEIMEPDITQFEKLKIVLAGIKEIIDPMFIGIKNGIEKINFDNILDSARRIKDSLVRIFTDIFDSISGVIDSISSTWGTIIGNNIAILGNLIDAIIEGIARFFEENEAEIAETIKRILENIKSIFDNIKAIYENIANIIIEVLQERKDDIANAVKNLVKGVFDVLSTIAYIISDAFNTVFEEIKTWITGNADTLKTFVDNTVSIVTNLGELLGQILSDIADSFKRGWEEYFKEIIASITRIVLAIGEQFLTWYNNIFAPLIEEILGWFKKVWDENLKDVVNLIIDVFGELVDSVTSFFENILLPYWKWLTDVASPVIKAIASVIIDIFGNAFNIASGFVKILLIELKGVIRFIKFVFKGEWSNAWNEVKNTFVKVFETLENIAKGTINTIIGIFNKLIEGIISGINKMLGLVGNVGFKLPAWLGGGDFKLSIPPIPLPPKIPELASGTVVPPNKEFMAILGDNTEEHEVVSPISTIEDAVRNVLLESGFNKQSTVVLQVDGRELGRVALPYINEEKSRIGTILSNRAVMA